nr:hypothetical protein BaRGS_020838 [Batillaria attramentaria]
MVEARRYYGKSLPFGNHSLEADYIGWLSVEQALADYAMLISYLKQSLSSPKAPVIAFGGSYGGMLSAYMRFKYPNLVTGSLAASAPIYMLDPRFDRSFFFSHVTYDFAMTGAAGCVDQVKKGFQTMDQLVRQGLKGLEQLTMDFQLCSPLVDSEPMYKHLQGWVRNAFTYLAMLDYPYPTDFLGMNLPANPVQTACNVLMNATDPVKGLAAAAGMFYPKDTSQTPPCFNMMADFIECADPTGCGTGPNALAWDYQACTEITLPDGSDGKTDMFPSLPFTLDMRRSYCKQSWGVTPRVEWTGVQFWGTSANRVTNGQPNPDEIGVDISKPSV